MKKRYSKKEVFLIVIYLISIFFIGIGVTFSYFSMVKSANKDSTKIYSGTLNINYIQGSDVSIDVLYPISEPSFNTSRNVYRNKFGVNTDGTLEQNVSIRFFASDTTFSNNSIKYALYNSNGTKIETGYINKGLTVLTDNLYFKSVETREFVLLLWLDENSKDQNLEQDKKLTGTIIIESTQLIS